MEWILLVVGVAVGAALGWWWGRRELGPQLDQAAEEVRSLTDERKRLERELRHSVERADQTDQRLAAAELAKSESEGAGEAAMAELQATKHDLAEAERSVKSLGHQLEKAEATRLELAERVTAAEYAAADAHARFDQVTEDYVALKRQARRAEEERDAAHTDRDGTVARLESATGQAQQEAAELRADHDRLEKALSVASARLQALGGSAEAAAEAQEELRALRTALAGQTRLIGELRSELDRTKSELAERESEVAELRSGSAPRLDDIAPPVPVASTEPVESTDSGPVVVSDAAVEHLPSFFATAGYDPRAREVVLKATSYYSVPIRAEIRLDGAAQVGDTGTHISIGGRSSGHA